MKNFIKRLKSTYTLENIRYMFSIRPVATVAAITGDVLIVVAIVVAVVLGIGALV
jgi:hypothetical protein